MIDHHWFTTQWRSLIESLPIIVLIDTHTVEAPIKSNLYLAFLQLFHHEATQASGD